MVYITGDTHGDYDVFKIKMFRFHLKKGDTLIICGDFGGVWYNVAETKFTEDAWVEKENNLMRWYASLPATICFIDGNHENYDRLYNDYPVVDFKGGKAHKIADNIFHLIRGEIFTIENQTFLAMGGAASHDIQDGVLEKDDPRIIEWSKDRYKMFRINHISWWKEEVPSKEEREHCYENIVKNNFQVDVVLTHEAPASLVPLMVDKWTRGVLGPTHEYSEWLDNLRQFLTYKTWCFGHYHTDRKITDNEYVLYNTIKECKDGCLVWTDSAAWEI